MNFNIVTLNAGENIAGAYNSFSESMNRLSSGLRISSAGDDPSGLAVRELLRADMAGARQSLHNVSDGISMLQTADGTLSTIGENLVRMRQLAEQASTGTYSAAQKNILQQEFVGLAEQIEQIAAMTSFNGLNLHQDGQTIEIAVGDGETISVDTEHISVDAADLINDPAGAVAAVNTAVSQISSYRGRLGATSNRLESAADVLDIKAENILAAESRISDVDVAREAASATLNRVALSAAVAAQAQANSLTAMVQMLLGE